MVNLCTHWEMSVMWLFLMRLWERAQNPHLGGKDVGEKYMGIGEN